MMFSWWKLFVALTMSANLSLFSLPLPLGTITNDCSESDTCEDTSTSLLLRALLLTLYKARRRTSSKRRRTTTPKKTPNAIPKMAFLLCCFLEPVGASAALQLRRIIEPHNFGFPSKLEFENVLNWPPFGIGPSRLL
uniref:Secreted protein n=1 Tax=Arundo donax TaxID=35708 RepID=A0A0A9D261_ARUDO